MAFCPQCKAEIDTMATKCPSCGFNFGESDATPKAAASGYLFSRPIAGYLSLAGVFAAALVLFMMVKAPGLSVVLVANAVFCLIVFSTLASLVRTGQVRFMSAGFTVGAVLYLIIVRSFSQVRLSQTRVAWTESWSPRSCYDSSFA